ncbi:MAG: 30S ribosomal protein S6 [Melioribacteraceae bacterium]|jgi:small subunit ribosomal protein S6|nr:30S ribosomal protein S6 [Melioribacteraceae bacterium]WKZ68572.1 MAG: 30S ribosomal protein S6 [Melioribacteraceae bacterium]
MTKRHYESVVILNAALEDEHIESTLTRIEEILKTNGAEISEIEKWGRKRLAYPIQKSKSGYYAIFRFEAMSETIAELERIYRLDETVVRYLTIVLGKEDLEHIAKMKERATQKEAEVSEKAVSEDKQTSD